MDKTIDRISLSYKNPSKHKQSFISFNMVPSLYTWERIEECRPAWSAPLMELERDSEGVEQTGGSTTEWVMDLRS